MEETGPYRDVLAKKKEEFEQKWGEKQKSTNEHFKDYDIFRPLGAGSFGVVVRIK